MTLFVYIVFFLFIYFQHKAGIPSSASAFNMSAAATQDPSLLGSWDSVYQTNSTNNVASAGSTATSGQAFLGQRLNAGGIPRNASTPNLEALAKADPFADLGMYLPLNKFHSLIL